MYDRYALSSRQVTICRVAAMLFAFAAVVRAVALPVPIVAGNGAGVEVRCTKAGCFSADRPDLLLPESERPAIAASPGAAATLANYARKPSIRAALVIINLAAALPFILLMSFVSAAVWRLGSRRDNDFARALPWVQRASIAALAGVLVPPVTDSLRAMVVFPATPSGPSWYFAIDVGPFLTGLLIAFAAFIVSWAIAAGSQARSDIAEIV